jgi:hypothetical protein
VSFAHIEPYRCARKTQMPLAALMNARIVMDQPFPIAGIKTGATSGVNPADKHLNKLAVLISEAAYLG